MNRACPTTGSDRGSLRDHDLTLIVMQSSLFGSPDFVLFLESFSPHNRTGFERGNQLIGCLEATRA